MGINNNKLANENLSADQYFADVKKDGMFREFSAILAGRVFQEANNENIGNLVGFSLGSEKYLGHVEPNALIAVMSVLDGGAYAGNPVVKSAVDRAIAEFHGEPEGYMLSALARYAEANQIYQKKHKDETLLEAIQKKNIAEANVEKYNNLAQGNVGSLKRHYEAKLDDAKKQYEVEAGKLGMGYKGVEEAFALAENAYAKRGEQKGNKSVDGIVATLIHNRINGKNPMFYDVKTLCAFAKAPVSQAKSKEVLDSLMSVYDNGLNQINILNNRHEAIPAINKVIAEGAEIYKVQLAEEQQRARAEREAKAKEENYNIFNQSSSDESEDSATICYEIVTEKELDDIMQTLHAHDQKDKGLLD